MTLRVWWATELYPDNNEESIGIAGDFPVIRLDELRAVVARACEALDRIAHDPNDMEIRRMAEVECFYAIQQLKGVGDEPGE